jgi:hypothetical protein
VVSTKQLELIGLYRQMASEGVDRGREACGMPAGNVPKDYSLMNIRLFREPVRPLFRDLEITSVLDYGSGSTSWDTPDFDGTLSAKQYFGVREVHNYEPGLGLDELVPCDAVVCFDVLEHVFLADVSAAVWDLFSYARKAVIVNVACYPARARLPNGENAHITVRPPAWWRGMFDAIAPAFPEIVYRLYASTGYGTATVFHDTCFDEVLRREGYERPEP